MMQGQRQIIEVDQRGFLDRVTVGDVFEHPDVDSMLVCVFVVRRGAAIMVRRLDADETAFKVQVSDLRFIGHLDSGTGDILVPSWHGRNEALDR